jgi:hypothetical protein
MNSFSMFINQAVLSIILSLSTTMIYAEVAAKDSASANITNTTPASNIVQPAQPSEKAGPVWQLRAEQWELARSGETILSLPVLNRLIGAWLSDKQKRIEIQYPGGEDGEFWVQELADWLVALGIPSKQMVITPGSGADDVIKFNLIK